MYPLLLRVGIVKGYRNTDLKKLAKETYGNTEGEPTKRKYTRKTGKVELGKPKRKYTERVKTEEVNITPEVKNKPLNILSSIFKKKNNTSELIKF